MAHTKNGSQTAARHVVESKSPRRTGGADTGMHATRNDLPGKTRSRVCEILNARLADLLDLYSQVKQAHWNVKGPGFHSIHLFLDELAEVIEEFADSVAERAVQLGGTAYGTTRMVAAATSLPEYPERLSAQQRTLQTITDRLAAVAKPMREGIDQTDEMGDADTADLLTDVSRGLDKYLWFTESHLHPGS
jgi:starvation-inducible DNA-binding protein